MSNIEGGDFISLQENYRNFEYKNLELNDKFSLLINKIRVTPQEKIIIETHEFTPETISLTYKDLLRIKVEKIVAKLFVRFGLENCSLDQLRLLLSEGRFIQSKLIVYELFEILENWNLILHSNEGSFNKQLVDSIEGEVTYMFRKNIESFLGENINFRPDLVDSYNVKGKARQELFKLIKVNKLSKIKFGYGVDYEEMEYVLATAIRCYEESNGEREAVELANQLFLFWIRYSKELSPDQLNTFVSFIRLRLAKYPEILGLFNRIQNLDNEPGKAFIEISPPLYRPMQRNVMVRVFIPDLIGYKVKIFSLPYNFKEIRDLISKIKNQYKGQGFTTYNSSEFENEELSEILQVDEASLQAIFSELPLIKDYSQEVIDLNEQIVDGEIKKIVDQMKPFIEDSMSNLTEIVMDNEEQSKYSQKYVDIIRTIFFKSSTNVKSNLGSKKDKELGEKAFRQVMDGASFQDIARDEGVEYKIEANGPCLVFEEERGNPPSIQSESKDDDFKFPTEEGETVVNVSQKNGVELKTQTTLINGEYRTVMTCPICKKGRFAIKPECDMTKEDFDKKCSICGTNIKEMKKWYELESKDEMISRFNEARKSFKKKFGKKVEESKVYNRDLEGVRPNWGDQLVSMMFGGLIPAEAVASAGEQ